MRLIIHRGLHFSTTSSLAPTVNKSGCHGTATGNRSMQRNVGCNNSNYGGSGTDNNYDLS